MADRRTRKARSTAGGRESGSSLDAAILERVHRIPPGFVTTYGQLCPGAPRRAGHALSQAPPGAPWWRVVRADGSLAMGVDQRRRLEAEDVPFRGAKVLMVEALVHPEVLRA